MSKCIAIWERRAQEVKCFQIAIGCFNREKIQIFPLIDLRVRVSIDSKSAFALVKGSVFKSISMCR